MNDNLNEIVSMPHRKFMQGTIEEVQAKLKEQHSANPQSIVYGLHLDDNFPGYIIISVCSSKGLRQEYIRVTPEGFSMKKRNFPRMDDLLNWFKRHGSEPSRPPPNRGPPRANGERPPMGRGYPMDRGPPMGRGYP